MPRGRSKGKGKNKGKENGNSRRDRSSSWPNCSPSPESSPPPEDPEEGPSRADLRWLHAGVYKDAQSESQDIWYSFKELKDGSYRIVYASDAYGSSLGNFNVGLRKRDLITFNDQYLRNWRRFLSEKGNWGRKKANRGRKCQRETLLEKFLDPAFEDPHPHGKDIKTVGPPLNVIHHSNDDTGPSRGARARASTSATPSVTPPEKCYPHTNIPLSTAKIRVGAFQESSKDATKVISNFLTGRMKYYPPGHRQRTIQVDRVESAFYDQGWRVDRAAVEQALEDMQEPGTTAFDSGTFTQNLPIRVDIHKGSEVEKLMVRIGGKENPDEADLDDEELFVPQEPKQQRPKSTLNKHGRMFETHLARNLAGRESAQFALSSDSDDDEKFEFLEADSPLKGKGPAPRKHARDEGARSQDNNHIKVDEERSTPAKRTKSESPKLESNWDDPIVIGEDSKSNIRKFSSNWDNPIVIDDDVKPEIDSDFRIIEELSCPKGRMKKEPSESIIILD